MRITTKVEFTSATDFKITPFLEDAPFSTLADLLEKNKEIEIHNFELHISSMSSFTWKLGNDLAEALGPIIQFQQTVFARLSYNRKKLPKSIYSLDESTEKFSSEISKMLSQLGYRAKKIPSMGTLPPKQGTLPPKQETLPPKQSFFNPESPELVTDNSNKKRKWQAPCSELRPITRSQSSISSIFSNQNGAALNLIPDLDKVDLENATDQAITQLIFGSIPSKN